MYGNNGLYEGQTMDFFKYTKRFHENVRPVKTIVLESWKDTLELTDELER